MDQLHLIIDHVVYQVFGTLVLKLLLRDRVLKEVLLVMMIELFQFGLHDCSKLLLALLRLEISR